MLALYSAESGNTSRRDECIMHLEGSFAIPEGHQAFPTDLDLNDGDHGFLPTLRSCKAQETSILLDLTDDNLPRFLDGIEWRGAGEPTPKVVLTPLFVTGLIAGFMIMGLNPRRPYDEEHKQFVQDLGRVSTAALSLSVSSKQAQAREAVLARQLTERERFIRTMAEVATVGIYSLSDMGDITYANSKFYKITEASAKPNGFHGLWFADDILEEDQQTAVDAFNDCRSGRKSASMNIRLKRKWTPPGSSDEQHCWILNSIASNTENNKVVGVVGCVADISHTMWALQLQKNAVKAAEESRKQHERFIVSRCFVTFPHFSANVLTGRHIT